MQCWFELEREPEAGEDRAGHRGAELRGLAALARMTGQRNSVRGEDDSDERRCRGAVGAWAITRRRGRHTRPVAYPARGS